MGKKKSESILDKLCWLLGHFEDFAVTKEIHTDIEPPLEPTVYFTSIIISFTIISKETKIIYIYKDFSMTLPVCLQEVFIYQS